MRVNLLTDTRKHNLALMKLSAWHKARGDSIVLNEPLQPCDLSYGSWLFGQKYPTDYAGGPAVDPGIRLDTIISEHELCAIDYDLYSIDYSLGYTWSYCPRKCGFCCVPKQNNPEKHHSIWEFHNSRFSKICLLNNNTFTDPLWRETFQEIWEARLKVIDENGYDLRLLDEEKLAALNQTQFQGAVHFSWDRIEDDLAITNSLNLLQRLRHEVRIYVLIGYPDCRAIDETDIYRCQVIADFGFDPFIMIYNNSSNRQLRQFRWLVNRTFSWRRLGFAQMWNEGYVTGKRR